MCVGSTSIRLLRQYVERRIDLAVVPIVDVVMFADFTHYLARLAIRHHVCGDVPSDERTCADH